MNAIDRKPYIATTDNAVSERAEKIRYSLLAVLAEYISKNGKEALLKKLEVDNETVDDWFANRRSFTLADISDMEKAFNVQIIVKHD